MWIVIDEIYLKRKGFISVASKLILPRVIDNVPSQLDALFLRHKIKKNKKNIYRTFLYDR